MWYIYILRCADNTLYTGVTTDIARRLREHNGEVGSGAKYTLTKRPVSMVHMETSPNRSQAQKREAAIKKLTRQGKEQLILDQK